MITFLVLSRFQSLSEGTWLPDKRLCKVTLQRGNDFKTMGFSVRGELHLHPEETLYLLERCKLVVDNLTAAQLYDMVDLCYYLVYGYFKQTGLVIVRADHDTSRVPIAFKVRGCRGSLIRRSGVALFVPVLLLLHGSTLHAIASLTQH